MSTLILDNPPDIKILGTKIKIEQSLFDWIDKAKQLLESYGFNWVENSQEFIKRNIDKDGWIDRPGNYESFINVDLPMGTFLDYANHNINFIFNIKIRFWKIAFKNKWELSYRWDYPFHHRMNELLKGFQDIKAVAEDGEEYSGVILHGGEDNLSLDKLWEVLEVKIPRVKALWEFLDERLKV